MEQFRVEPEFQNKIPPISEDEFKQLRENILAAGEVYEPLVVWNGVLVDGHNRWKIIQESPDIKYKVRRMDFPDKWAAFEWMYKNQLGRRNLTDEQRDYTIGKMYEARRHTEAFKGNQYTSESGDGQNVHNQTRRVQRNGVSGEIGKEFGIDGRTVRRNEKFARGVDALREVSPEAADKVLNGKADITKAEVQEIGKMEPDKVAAVADIIMNPPTSEEKRKQPERKPKSKPQKYSAKTPEDKKELQEIEAIVHRMYDPTATPEFTIDFLIEDIEVNGQVYVELLDNTLKDRSNLVTEPNKPRIAAAIQNIEDKIRKVRESI